MVAGDPDTRQFSGPDEAGREFYHHLPVGLYRAAPDGRLLDANPELVRMLGYPSAAALLATNARDLYVNPADRVRWQAEVERDERVTNFDAEMRARDGRVLWLRDSARVVRDEQGTVIAYEGALVDVTAEHRAEERLRESEQRYRALIESMPDALFRFSREGTCLDARPGVLEDALPPLRQMIGARIEALFESDLTVALLDAIARCRYEGPVAFEYRLSGGRSGAFHDVCVSPAGAGETLVMIRDVTALRRLREWLLRTERLASVGTLATGAAHEINNPLTAVVVNTEFAREAMREIINEAAAALARSPDADPEPLRRLTARSSEIDDALADVSTGAARIAQVVRELKAFASPADDEVSWVEIESVLEAALNLTESQIKQRARLVRDLSDVPPVWGNAARLEELFVSLLVRACASIPPGAADRNEISVTTRAAADGRVVVSVSDSGAAIAKADLARIFDPFASPRGQGDEAVLGMPVCQAIASAYGGEITAESTEGKGSCFSVWLLTMATLRRSSPPRYGAPRAGRIAIIDDEHLGGRALQRALGADHEVVLMQSADEALAQLGRGVRFDLILCDVMMPVMSGVDFHRELVRRYPDQAQRTVFITGGAMTDTVRDYLGRLPNAVLEKPVSTAKLREIAARQVSSHRSSVTPDPDSMRH